MLIFPLLIVSMFMISVSKAVRTLQGFLFQFLYIFVYTLQFFRNVDALRAMGIALRATGAVVGLSKLGHATVVTYQISPPGLTIVPVLRICRDVAVVYTFVVMQQNCRNIYSVRARHTIFTVVARDLSLIHI